MTDTRMKELMIEEIPIARKYFNVFLEDIPDLPPDRGLISLLIWFLELALF